MISCPSCNGYLWQYTPVVAGRVIVEDTTYRCLSCGHVSPDASETVSGGPSHDRTVAVGAVGHGRGAGGRAGASEAGLPASSAHERWLPVPGYGLYEVSDLGRVRSLPRRRVRGGILKPRPGRGGYHLVDIYRDRKRRTAKVHHLVLEAFVGEPEPGQECRHLDGDPSNNRLVNLTWGTSSENKLDKVRHGTDHNASKTTCPQDHPYDYRDPQGFRRCRTCERARPRRRDMTEQRRAHDERVAADTAAYEQRHGAQ